MPIDVAVACFQPVTGPAGTAGAIAASFLTMTAAGNETETITGTGAASFLAMTAAVVGTETMTGAGAASFLTPTTVATGTAFSPMNISGCRLWLPADHVTPIAGNFVDTWADQSGSGVCANFLQSTGANQPSYVASGFNSLPDIESASNVRGLVSSTRTALGTTALTLACAASFTTATKDLMVGGARYNNYHYDITSSSTTSGRMIFRVNTSVTGVVSAVSDSTSLNDGALHRYIGVWDGVTVKLYVDGVLQASNPAAVGTIVAPSANTDNNSVMIASNGTALGNGWNGKLTDFIAYNVAISSGNVSTLDAWLATR